MSYGYRQVLHNLDTNRPTVYQYWNSKGKHIRTTHYIESDRYDWNSDINTSKTKVFLPKSVSEAKRLLRMGVIQPAPIPHTHHWRCGNWLSNHNAGNCVCEELIAENPRLADLEK